MNIAFCASEVFPYSKTGGLADVCGSLPKALAEQGCAVKVFTPWYRGITPQIDYGAYGYTRADGVEYYFIRHDQYYHREGIYGNYTGEYADNFERYCYFCNEVFLKLKFLQWKPDVLHINDWQTCPAGIFLKTRYRQDALFKKTKIILTIHNIAYQGIFPKERFPVLGVSWDYFNAHSLEFYDQINLLKGGIVFADAVNTVSPTYAKQIQTKDYGCRLDGVLRDKRACLRGILNAVDYNLWNPATDKFIEKRYSLKNFSTKIVNKNALRQELGLRAENQTPLLIMVSRLTDQKGIDILIQALPALLRQAQVAILGIGELGYCQTLRQLECNHRNRFKAVLKFDENAAHKFYAAADGFLMPSRFEPCGLSQMIGYAYGVIPIAHSTGGLVDTVIDVNHGGCGFVFDCYSGAGLIRAVERLCEIYRDKKCWRALVKQAMRQNYFWKKTARVYIEMYKNTLKQNNNKYYL